MAHKISNVDFFQRCIKEAEPLNEKRPPKKASVKAAPIKIGKTVDTILADSKKALDAAGCPSMAAAIENIRRSAERERFTVAVVGEFSRGKSTFINRMLGRDFLPEGDLPTTAVMTRIRYNDREVVLAFDENNRKVLERGLSRDSWKGLIAQNFGGEDFKGTALVGINSEWLRDRNVELIDTPGAGDLSEERAKVVGDVLLGCDGAVITVSALSALSLSEKLFIEERLMARKLPFLMLVITKLDQVSPGERAQVVRYIINKLKGWNMDIPVYIPYPIEMEDNSYQNIIGMDKVMNEISGWVSCAEREKLVETWLLGKTSDILKNASSALAERIILLEESDEKKREEQIAQKKLRLAEARLEWGDLRLQMQGKCAKCYEFLLAQTDGFTTKITERLQYEVSHANDLQKWWQEDFPYRIKIELANMSVSIENRISRRIEEDVRWYCMAIEQNFKSHVLYQKETISDEHMFDHVKIENNIELEDFGKKRTAIKIGSAVLSVSGFALFSAIGFMPMIATMGVGTGTTIFSEHFFKKKLEEQREKLKEEIARCVPTLMEQSIEESEKRLESVYKNIMDEADKSEQAWLAAQQTAMDGLKVSEGGKNIAEEKECLRSIDEQIERIDALLQ